MKEIILLRHGATGNAGRYTGTSDVALSPEGRLQILDQVPLLAAHTFRTVYCSPRGRCLQTRDLLEMPSAIVDRRLAEIDFGEWEGKTFGEIARGWPDLVEQWRTAEDSFRFPGGESLRDFRARIDDFAGVMQSLPAGKVLLVTHGGVIRHLVCRFLGLPYSNHISFKPECGKFAVVELHSEGGVLTGFNRGSEHG